jgi:hypothetical protein
VNAAVLTTLVLIVAAAAPGHAFANGGTLRLNKTTAGPHLVSVWTQPDPPWVGRLDVSVAVMRPSTGEPVLDVTGSLSAEPLSRQGATVSARLERGAGGNLLLYHGELELPTAGPWRVTVHVEGPTGEGTATFELDVHPSGPLAKPWLLGAMGLLVAGAVGWLWARRKRGQKPD